jgi:hypothetical protein|nr:MAG TPA: hypothetical protein [Bacteriophage sp.]
MEGSTNSETENQMELLKYAKRIHLQMFTMENILQ